MASDPTLEWNWDLLHNQVLEDPLNRHWIYHPALERFPARADETVTQTEAFDDQPKYEQEKLRCNGVPICLRTHAWGITLWSAYNEDFNAFLKHTARQFGGQWKPKYKNWVYPSGVKSLIEEALRARGARRE
ncbi:hypothetical protein [Thioalkalivibrio sp. ALE20]|uniref:hypothetical protein n=1 Tax=Thioalkalivibrio sp. ALE20 TaxID=545275 RepID=UPI0012E9B963|nr:hypothetical protein [Thioalkalivibrio sp. ALE20]